MSSVWCTCSLRAQLLSHAHREGLGPAHVGNAQSLKLIDALGLAELALLKEGLACALHGKSWPRCTLGRQHLGCLTHLGLQLLVEQELLLLGVEEERLLTSGVVRVEALSIVLVHISLIEEGECLLCAKVVCRFSFLLMIINESVRRAKLSQPR